MCISINEKISNFYAITFRCTFNKNVFILLAHQLQQRPYFLIIEEHDNRPTVFTVAL